MSKLALSSSGARLVQFIGKISDYKPGGSGFNVRPGRGLNFGRPYFATPSVDRDVKPFGLVFRRSDGGIKTENPHLSQKEAGNFVLWSVNSGHK